MKPTVVFWMQGRRDGRPGIRPWPAAGLLSHRAAGPRPAVWNSHEVRVGDGGEGAAGWRGPAEDAGGDLFELPVGMVLEDVMGSAEARLQVITTHLAILVAR